MRALHAIYKSVGPTLGPVDFASQALSTLRIDCPLSEEALARIPLAGRVIIVANHPFGALDGLAAIRIVGARRPDVRVLANADLASIPELAPLIFAADPLEGGTQAQRNSQALRKAWRWLEGEHALVVFPAGEIAHFDPRARCVTDPPWNPTIARLVQKTGAQVVPLYFAGRNSGLFQLAGFVAPQLRTLLLPGELRQRIGSRIDAHLGDPIDPRRISQFKNPEALALHLRLKTFLAPANEENIASSAFTSPLRVEQPIAVEMPVDCIGDEIARLDPRARLVTQGGIETWLATADQIPHTLAEIGRLRELTFRSAGEGTGLSRDIDRFDPHYEHLFLWHSANRQIVGACRLGRTDEIRRKFGRQGLYTSILFQYRDLFFMALGPALELGRSFVRPEYQRSFAPLMLLWKGIAEFVVRNPRYSRLIGPVSVGGGYGETSRHLLVDFLRGQRFDRLLGGLVSARNPVPRSTALRSLASELAILGTVEPLSTLVEDLEPDGKGIPILLRQYLKLGARVLAFNVDAAFGQSIDCLLLVDLRHTPPRELCKYMSKESAARFERQRLFMQPVRPGPDAA